MKKYTISNNEQLDAFLKFTESERAELQILELAFGLRVLCSDKFQMFCNTLSQCVGLQTLKVLSYCHFDPSFSRPHSLVSFRGAQFDYGQQYYNSLDHVERASFDALCAALAQCEALTQITGAPYKYQQEALTTITNNHTAFIQGIQPALDDALPKTPLLAELQELIRGYVISPNMFPEPSPTLLLSASAPKPKSEAEVKENKEDFYAWLETTTRTIIGKDEKRQEATTDTLIEQVPADNLKKRKLMKNYFPDYCYMQ